MQSKTARLNKYAKQAGLYISTTAKSVVCINSTPTAPIHVNRAPLDFVEDFTYLDILISKPRAAQKDIKTRLGHVAFPQLRTLWRRKQCNLKTKMLLYNSNVKSVLLCGSECWRVVNIDMRKL